MLVLLDVEAEPLFNVIVAFTATAHEFVGRGVTERRGDMHSRLCLLPALPCPAVALLVEGANCRRAWPR